MTKLLLNKKVIIEDINEPAASFIIERFHVPTQTYQLIFELTTYCPDYQVASMMVYDSQSNLRLDSQLIGDGRRLKISQDQIDSSACAKAGPMPVGEWIIVFKLFTPLPKEAWLIACQIRAIVNAQSTPSYSLG